MSGSGSRSRQADRLEGDDLLKPGEIAGPIQAIAGSAAHRLQESKAVVVPKRLHGDARQYCELVDSIRRGHVKKVSALPQGESQLGCWVAGLLGSWVTRWLGSWVESESDD